MFDSFKEFTPNEDTCFWDDDDVCYECGGYGDDFYVGETGELVCRCLECPFNKIDFDEYNDGRIDYGNNQFVADNSSDQWTGGTK